MIVITSIAVQHKALVTPAKCAINDKPRSSGALVGYSPVTLCEAVMVSQNYVFGRSYFNVCVVF